MASDAILRIKVIADASQAALGLDQTASKAGKFSSAMRKAALPAAAVGAAVVAMGKKAVDAASDLQQAEGAVEAVFGKKLAGQVEKYANSAAQTMGLSAADYQNYAALVGTALQNAGFSAKQSVEESNKVMQRGADLSALYGGSTADAVDAINAAVSRSEFDPLEKYGVSLNMTAVNAELAAKGQDKLTGAALDTAKKQIILEKIYKDTSKAAGQYAREADSVAGRQQTAAAQWTNAAAALGQVLLPVVSAVIAKLATFASWAQKNTTTVQVFAGVLLGLAAAVLAINAAMKVAAAGQLVWNAATAIGSKLALGTRIQLLALAAAERARAAATLIAAGATKVAAVAMRLFNAAFIASPIGIVVALVIALGVALYIAYQKSATFRAFVDGMWAGIQAAAQATWQVIKTVWDAVLNAGKAVFDWFKANWQYALAGVLAGPFGIAVVLIIKHFDKVKAVARAVWEALKAGARAATNVVKTVFSSAFRVVAAVVRTQMAAVRRAISLVRGAASSVAAFVKAVLGGAWRFVVAVARTQFAAVRTVINTVRNAVSAVASFVRNQFTTAWNSVKRVATAALNAITRPISTLRSAIDGVIGAVQSLISWLGKIKVPSIKIPGIGSLSSLNPFSAAAPAAAAPSLLAARAATTSSTASLAPTSLRTGRSVGTGNVVNLTVNGAIDPEATARQIRRVLTGHNVRMGLAT